ncbi:diguanylate phosphodiesterase [Mesorhizobium sp. L-8-10]|uniref:EAL domain-containing protein n=1 Tax=unclassified Mesorhizobium TaxID=325217 RepID=UPI001927A6E6|nr:MULTISPECIES: EAL domain-containing protein [unclassified Mesorhizobium]BCH23794.1 diguanylate phosphodiesterase [Mesorhizobium sp. L-8-3]BCH31524.1 diguanylate phosphodiesterase [Mesorhizobium sp. L-8-10]
MNAQASRPVSVNDAIVTDEIGIEFGVMGDYRLKCAYQPIFRRDAAHLRPVAVEGTQIAFLEGERAEWPSFMADVSRADRSFVDRLGRTLSLRNHRNIGLPEMDLLFTSDPIPDGDVDRWPGPMALLPGRLEEIDLDPARLICEINDAVWLDREALLDLATGLRRAGLRIAVGDFGSGHATLERIGLVKPDIVTIDEAWFHRLCEDEGTVRLFGPIAATFRQLGSQVLVSGIETPAQLRIALDGGADLLQGPLLSTPALAGSTFDETPLLIEKLLRTSGKVVPLFGKNNKHKRR